METQDTGQCMGVVCTIAVWYVVLLVQTEKKCPNYSVLISDALILRVKKYTNLGMCHWS